MPSFSVPSFGFSNSNPQDYGSPKGYNATPVYQPMPAVGTPSFGGFRPITPKEPSRHSSYSTKEIEPTIQTIQPSVERVRRHREYYLEGGDIFFLVENYLFRVHKYFFDRESPVFRKQFADNALNGHHRVGASDNEPLVLHDVRTDDFSRFLWVFYNPIYSIYDATTEDWAVILGLAHHWQFGEVKSLVVRELEKQIIPSIYKIVIYHRYDVDRGLLLPSYMDLVSREETLNYEEAKDLGLETSLMIMTAREIVRKGEAPTATVNVSPEELRNIIRQVFRFPGPRSDTPLSDITAAEPAFDHRSPPVLAEKTDLPTVPEHESEPVTFTTSASLNSPLPPVTETPVPEPAPIKSTPIFPAKKQPPSKPAPTTPKKEDTQPAPVSPPKEGPKPKQEPVKPTPLPSQKDGSKPGVQEPVKPTTEEPSKPETQDSKKKPILSRLTDVSKAAGSPTPAKDAAIPKDKEGDKPADDKETKGAKSTTDEKDAAGPPAAGQDSNETPNETPIGTPLLNLDTDRLGTPSTGLGGESQNPPGSGRKNKKNKGGGGNGPQQQQQGQGQQGNGPQQQWQGQGNGPQQQQQQQGQGRGNAQGKPQSPVNNKSGSTFTSWF